MDRNWPDWPDIYSDKIASTAAVTVRLVTWSCPVRLERQRRSNRRMQSSVADNRLREVISLDRHRWTLGLVCSPPTMLLLGDIQVSCCSSFFSPIDELPPFFAIHTGFELPSLLFTRQVMRRIDFEKRVDCIPDDWLQ